MESSDGFSRWVPTRNAKCGVAIYDFIPDQSDPNSPYLKLQFGDVVQILEENSGWYRGFFIRDKSLKGVFPASYVHLKDYNVINPGPAEIIRSKEDPMVQEVSDVLREWCGSWKKLYADGKRQQFEELKHLLKELLERRRQIMSKTLPRDELRELKQRVAQKIDYGNKFLGLDMIAREENGEVVNPKTSGVMKLFKSMRSISQQNSESTPATASLPGQVKVSRAVAVSTAPKKEEHHLFIKFSALALPVNEPCDLLFFLYDGKLNKILSERYMICLSHQCLPKNSDKIGQCFAVFTDLDNSDLQNKDLYLACQVIRVGNELDGRKTSAPLRKPHGAGVFPIHELLNTKEPILEEQEPQIDIFQCPPAEYHRLLENVVKKQGVYHATDKGTGVFVGVRVLRGALSKVKEDNPLLFKRFTAIVKKLSFAEIIRPYDDRHDVYLTLQQGVFSKGSKRADKNVEVAVEVLGDDDNPLPFKCINPGIGEENVSIYTSLVHYHLATPIFNETLKIEIPPESMRKSRVRFSFYHKSTIISSKLSKSEPFAMSHLRLMKDDDTTIADGQHELYVYNYKDLAKHPHRLAKLSDVATGSLSCPQEFLHLRDSFSVITHICSTKLTQNADLHRLLHWHAYQDRLPEILKSIENVGGNEIVKFLVDTFNALFAIIEEKGEKYGDPVFEALILIIGLLVVEKYENFRPVLDSYCEKHFNVTSIHTFLVKKMKYIFEQVMLMDNSKRKVEIQIINKTMKAAEFLFKFIMRSRYLYDQTTHGKGNEQFMHSLIELLRVTCNMMAKECPEGELVAPKAQAQAMQFFPQIFDLLLEVISVKALGQIVADFLLTIKETKLRVYKNVFLAAVVSSQLFTQKESRSVVLRAILRHIKYHISQREEGIQRDDLEKSLEIMGNVIVHLHSVPPVDRDNDMRVLVNVMLRPLLECFNDLSYSSKDRQHPQLGLCVSCVMGFIELMTPDHYRKLRATFDIKEDLEEFILTTFYTYSEIISVTALHPQEWSSLRLLHNHIILGAVKQIARILVEEYLDDIEGTSTVFFNCNLWERFFNLCVDFCCQPSLQLEKMTELKRKRILDLYGDMRLTMNTLMLDKWRMLGNFQANFVPGMVGPFLKVSLLPHEGLRKATIPVFFDMMEHEWKYNKNFHRMEIEMIDKLDVYVSNGMGDPSYRISLQEMLTEKWKSHSMANESANGMKFINSLAELLKRLLDYREVHLGDEYRDLNMHVVFNLLNFYKSIGREEIYLRYIYRLAELHKLSNNWIEAAFTLLLHAQLLQWSSSMLKAEGPYERQSMAERKMALYNDIISYFDKGKLWEYGIEQSKEIAGQLESVTFDYEKLSQIHETISRFYMCILKEIRAEPMFFRVGFFGGFPTFLKNKIYIFRGLELEKLTDFNARLQSTFPFAKFLTKLEPPGLDIIESTDQYIQSCAVEPLPDPNIMKKFEGKQVKEEITRYCRTNNVKHFLLKRPFHQGKKDKSNEYKTLHIERTVYTTEYQFPGILRWFPVVDSEVTVLNPIENGAELIEDNVNQLRTLINRYRTERHNTNPLTMKLNGTLDAAVNGGVSNFDVFFTHEYLSEHPNYKTSIPRLKMLMETLGQILQDGVQLHSEICPETMRKLHERMEELLKEYLSKYGDQHSDDHLGTCYDPTGFLDLNSPDHKSRARKFSSSRRREALKESGRGARPRSGSYEKSQGLSGSPIMEMKEQEADPPPVPEHRTRAQTEGNPLGASTPPMQRRQESTGTPGTPGAPVSVRDYDDPPPPKVPTKQRRGSVTMSPTPPAPTPPPTQLINKQVAADPPTVPLRRGNSRTPSGSPNQSRPTSLTSSGEATDDGPRPPPRVASVRNVGTGLSKSKSAEAPSKEGFEKTSPAASPNHSSRREGNSGPGPDASPLRSVKDIAAGLNRDSEPVPPPVPKKMHKQQSSLQALKNGES
ncbi:PREDICTED: dedicator of cytokinesis protein 1 isoform X1 [Amphimedon queenslandica]|uniref:Dedicator of cytokinesis protein 1 n=1 Tax=Amphimedon queenslandica TaxID=400682 RepID=A0A1X7VQ86_AMPQE|nr:PREDICTED: dedicator of cytokinesis protein 1 isoform X1 [Amphimedon queenslandica]|eukprot:XP_019859385.1 PREDICTED: dedicator of cytokinesis protein 1 isoform X1 [Amphimedon queenslandica]